MASALGARRKRRCVRRKSILRRASAIVVDIDLEKFFDRVNHDILMGLVAKRVSDRRILRLIRGFLTAGVLADGLVGPTDEGTPQGGPLSPLLSNLMLDVLDRELERRGHRFVRYADDCNIYVRSRRAGERVMASVERFLARRLKLKINQAKSAVDHPSRPQVPGLQLHGREAAPAAHRAAGAHAVQEPGPGTNAPEARRQPRADRRRTIALSHRMARLLRLLRNAVGVARPRPVDQATAPRLRVEAMEARTHPLCGAAPPRRRQGPGGAKRQQPARPMADQQQPRADHCLPNAFLRIARPRNHRKQQPLKPPNRRVRTRTHGGVGGEKPRGFPLSRLRARTPPGDHRRGGLIDMRFGAE